MSINVSVTRVTAIVGLAASLICGCAQKESVQVKAQRLKVSSPEWPKVVATVGTNSGELKRVDRFTTTAVSGRIMLSQISDPVERQRALAAWDKDVNRVLPSLARPEHRDLVRQMLTHVPEASQ
jgi:hypothetical protein